MGCGSPSSTWQRVAVGLSCHGYYSLRVRATVLVSGDGTTKLSLNGGGNDGGVRLPARAVENEAVGRGIVLAGGAGTRLYPLAGRDQAADAGVRQADGVLPVIHTHAGGHTLDTAHLRAIGPAGLRTAARLPGQGRAQGWLEGHAR